MKRKFIAAILMAILFISTLNGCASSDAMNKQISTMQEEINKQSGEMQEEISKQADNTTEIASEQNDIPEEPASEIETDSQLKTTDLFEQVYIPYANREKSFIFDAVKEFTSTLGYQTDITEPTEDDLGTIKVIDINGDYVYFAFMPINGIEMVMTVNYYRNETNSEVSLSNYSTDGSSQYDKFTTHTIDGNMSENEVSNTDEQRIFLFN